MTRHARRTSTAARRRLTPTDHPATQAAARAIEAVYGVPPVYIREGGSIPVTAAFDHVLGLPVVLLGFASPRATPTRPTSGSLHENFEGGTRVIVRLWDELGALERLWLGPRLGRPVPSAVPGGPGGWRRAGMPGARMRHGVSIAGGTHT